MTIFLTRKNKYSIRKFTVGAASILIGSMILAGQGVRAEDNSILQNDGLDISDILFSPLVTADTGIKEASVSTFYEDLGETGPKYNFQDLKFNPTIVSREDTSNQLSFEMFGKHNIAASSDNWVINLQIDERFAQYITSMTIQAKDGGDRVFVRKNDALGRLTNIWQVNYIRANNGLFKGAETTDTQTASNGVITFEKPIQEILAEIGDNELISQKLLYRTYLTSKQDGGKIVSGIDSTGFFKVHGIDDNDLSELSEKNMDWFKHAGLDASSLSNHPEVLQNGKTVDAIVVDQKISKERNFAYGLSANEKEWKLKFGVDPRLVKYIDGIELYKMDATTTAYPDYSIDNPNNYKVADLSIERREGHENYGYGIQTSNRFDRDLVNTANASPRPITVRYVYKLNKPLDEILRELKTEAGVTNEPFGEDFLFSASFLDRNNKLIKNTDAVGVYQIQDIDGDGRVDDLESMDGLSPFIGNPTLTAPYENETVVNAQVHLHELAGSGNVAELIDQSGKIIATTEVNAVDAEGKPYTGTQSIEFQLAEGVSVGKGGDNLSIRILPKDERYEVPEYAMTTVQEVPRPVEELILIANKELLVDGPEATKAIVNSYKMPEGTTFEWKDVSSIDLSGAIENTEGVILVKVPDRENPFEVTIPIKVTTTLEATVVNPIDKAVEGQSFIFIDSIIPSDDNAQIISTETNGLKVDESGSVVGTPVIDDWKEADEAAGQPREMEREIKIPVTISLDGVVLNKEVSVTVERDTDGDGIPDSIDDDIDGDGILNDEDANPFDYDNVAAEFIDVQEPLFENERIKTETVVKTNKPNAVITSTETNGLSIDEFGQVRGLAEVSDWGPNETERVIYIPFTVSYENDVEVTGQVAVTLLKAKKYTDIYEATSPGVTKEFGQPVTEQEVRQSVVIKDILGDAYDEGNLPVIIVLDPLSLPDGKTEGTTTVSVLVTYPDDSSQVVEVEVTIGEPLSNQYLPTPEIIEKEFGQSTLEQEIRDAIEFMPEYTEAKQPVITIDDPSQLPDGQSAGSHIVSATVRYPDGSTETVEVTVNVAEQKLADKVEPVVNSVDKDFGQSVTEDDIKGAVTFPDYPEDTAQPTVSVKEGQILPDGTSAGAFVVEVTIEYPDGSSEEAKVTINVGDSDATRYQSKITDLTKPYGEVTSKEDIEGAIEIPGYTGNYSVEIDPDAELPDGKTPGDYTVGIVIKFADGSQEENSIKITVEEQKLTDKYEVTANSIQKGYGQLTTEQEIREAISFSPEYTEDKVATVVIDDPSKLPNGLEAGTFDVSVTIKYPDGTEDKVVVPVTVGESLAATYSPNIDKVEKDFGETVTEQNVRDAVTFPGYDFDTFPRVDVNNVDQLPNGETSGDYPVDVTITYPDGSKINKTVTITIGEQADNEKYEPIVPTEKVEVADKDSLTEEEKAAVENAVKEANKDNFPDGTEVKAEADGSVTITYPDKTTETIPGADLVFQKSDAEKYEPILPTDKVEVADKDNLTAEEKEAVKNNVESANQDNFPAGTQVEVGTDGTVTITYPDDTQDTINGGELVVEKTVADNEKYEPIVPADKVEVADKGNLTEEEKGAIKNAVEEANQGNFPENTTVEVGNDGSVTITYPDGTKDTISGDRLVIQQSDAEKYEPEAQELTTDLNIVPDAKQAVINLENLPSGTEVLWRDEPTVTEAGTNTGTILVVYPDGTTDTVEITVVVEDNRSDDEKYDAVLPADKTAVSDISSLTEAEKVVVKEKIETANKDNFPENTLVEVGNDGSAKITYPDGTFEEIPSEDLVVQIKDAEKYTANFQNIETELNVVPAAEVAIENLNELPVGTRVVWEEVPVVNEVGDISVNAIVIYPDGSMSEQVVTITIKDNRTDAEKYDPIVPTEKVEVADKDNLTAEEKGAVKNNVESANQDNFPTGTRVEVGTDSAVTITYPDGTKDTISGGELIVEKVTADNETYDPIVPTDKVEVADKDNLTAEEKGAVKNNVESANQDNFPTGTRVEVGNDGTVTITYPDGTKDSIKAEDLVVEKVVADKDKYKPVVPETKIEVADEENLTDKEKEEVKNNVLAANKDNFPEGTKVEVGTDGTVTITYPDGTQNVISGSSLVVEKTDNNEQPGDNETETPGDTNKPGSGSGNTGQNKPGSGNGAGQGGDSEGTKVESSDKSSDKKGLPNTGTVSTLGTAMLTLLGGLGLTSFRKKEDEE